MEAAREHPSVSFLSRVLDRWRDFESALELRPEDLLEKRIAELERRVTALTGAAQDINPQPRREF